MITPITKAIIVDDIIVDKVIICQKNNNLVLAHIPTQHPFACARCIFNEMRVKIINDIKMGLIPHLPK
jgi:hypothetical protein